MKKPNPVNSESVFNFDELFFSATDHRGIIDYGNEVFIRVSSYPRDEILGKPHNIIRHPDMPKCVFKIFWDTLKSGSPVAAYVKNMSADGQYYWVFAFAFPVESGYLSIRFKPTSPLFKTVQELYAETLRLEKSSNMEKAEEFLLEKLKEFNFKNYRQFMIHAAVTELQSLDNALKNQAAQTSSDMTAAKIARIKQQTVTSLNKSFAKMDDFATSGSIFSERIALLETEFKKLKKLSINMSILANKFGSQAASLSVIAEYFSDVAAQIEKELGDFAEFSKKLILRIEQCTLEMAALKTQMNMVEFYVREGSDAQEMMLTKDMFTSLFAQSATSLIKELGELNSESLIIGGQILEIKKFINGLEIIKQTGSIESSRHDEIKSAFSISLNEMAAFNSILRASIGELDKAKSQLSGNSNEIRETINGLQDNIQNIFDLVLRIKEQVA